MTYSNKFKALLVGLVLTASTPALAGPAHDKALLQTAKNLTSALLKYPETAQFKALRIVFGTDGSRAVCGHVTAKGNLGSYVDYLRFMVIHGQASIELEQTPTTVAEVQSEAVFNFIWNTFCSEETI